MAAACKCDRCRKYYMPDAGNRIPRIRFGKAYIGIDGLANLNCENGKTLDLCWDCMSGLCEWLIGDVDGGSKNDENQTNDMHVTVSSSLVESGDQFVG